MFGVQWAQRMVNLRTCFPSKVGMFFQQGWGKSAVGGLTWSAQAVSKNKALMTRQLKQRKVALDAPSSATGSPTWQPLGPKKRRSVCRKDAASTNSVTFFCGRELSQHSERCARCVVFLLEECSCGHAEMFQRETQRQLRDNFTLKSNDSRKHLYMYVDIRLQRHIFMFSSARFVSSLDLSFLLFPSPFSGLFSVPLLVLVFF